MTSLFGGGAKAVSKTPTRAMGIDLQGSQYGPPIPVVFGQNKVAGNVIWYGDFKATSHTQKQPGKGGGGSSSTSYTYSCSFELGLCEGVANVVNVYQGSSTVSLSRSGGIAFSGTTGQAAWSHLTGSAALGYSGTALAAFQNLELGSSASLPNFNFEVAARNQFGGGVVDANPADIVSAVCSDAQIGVGFSALGDLTAFKNYCTAAGIFFSPVYSTQNPAHQTLDDLFKYANAAPFFSEGVLKVVPYGDATITGNGVTYTPNTTAVVDLGRDDFITNGPGDPVTIHRISPADAMNLVRVEYKDRANTYHTNAVVASIDQDVVGTGSRADQSESVDMITQAAVARLVAQNLLQRIYYIRNAYQFQLSWRYCYLEPMDIVTLTDANTGLYLTPVRITEIGEDEHGLLSVTAEEFPEGVSHGGTYGTQPNSGATVDPNADPGPIDAPHLFRGPGFLVSNVQPEIWCALTGNSALWAGCDVYISHDGTSYSYLATTSKSAAYGHLTNTLASAADPDTTGAPNVVLNGAAQLLGGSMADADQFITLAMVDSELIAYQTATLASGPSYTLGYIRRGGYGSAIASHAVNAPFVRLDDNILRIPVDPSQIGQTVYLKFVSFNVFGKGGRTLAGETAYTYVVGTNIELPDVPVTPVSVSVTGVADGNSIVWYNSNPAAVGCTSIEYATASTGPWTVLAQVGPTTTAYAHHFTNGATYFYRLRSRGPVVAGGWSAYTSVYSATGTNVGAISNAANTANANTPSVINPQLKNGTAGWTFDNPAGFYQETGSNSPDSACNTYLVRQGQAGGAITVARDLGYVSVVLGQTVTALCCLKSLSANAGSYAGVRISWRDSTHTELSVTHASVTCGPGGTYLQCVSKAVGQAPANAQFAHLEIEYVSHSSGYLNATSCGLSLQPASQDEVPDGSTFARVRAGQLSGGVISLLGTGRNPIPNPNFTAVSNGTPANVALGVGTQLVDNWTVTGDVAYRGTGVACRMNPNAIVPANGSLVGGTIQSTAFAVVGGQPFALRVTRAASFSTTPPAWLSAAHRVRIVFYDATGALIGAGTFTQDRGVPFTTTTDTYTGTAPGGAATAVAVLSAYYVNSTGTVGNTLALYTDCATTAIEFVQQTDLASEVKGTLSTQRNLPLVTWGNYGGMWSGLTLNYSTTTTSCTFSASAASFVGGGDSIAYNSGSVTVSGTAGSVVTYYLYYDDPTMTGGTKSLQATTAQLTSLNANGRVLVGKATVTYPTSGTGSGGGGSPCPDENAWVLRADPEGLRPDWPVRAKEIGVGHHLRLTDGRAGKVTYSQRKAADRVQVFDENGATLTCSTSAPLELAGEAGECVLAPDASGRRIKALADGVAFDPLVWKVEDAGPGYVQHITCENACFWTGDDPDFLFAHHNLKPLT